MFLFARKQFLTITPPKQMQTLLFYQLEMLNLILFNIRVKIIVLNY